ncbi:hypothetical protein SAMN05216268_1443 [Streptomyces yunnanensis]|uniref:Uncharacterized protein n=1 Tax=Streptomyces yunnanensis TaxID=156453 RepID=A0A9X8R0G4_9ACTN|nr:hypothetical protein SAMN05216268_1443 [Streptomyces yunnanensis]
MAGDGFEVDTNQLKSAALTFPRESVAAERAATGSLCLLAAERRTQPSPSTGLNSDG